MMKMTRKSRFIIILLMIFLLLGSALLVIPARGQRVFAFDIINRLYELVSPNKKGFDLNEEANPEFIYTKKTPNYQASAGSTLENRKHRIKLTSHGQSLEFGYLKSARVTSKPSQPEPTATPILPNGSTLDELDPAQQEILNQLNEELSGLKTDIASVSTKVATLAAETEEVIFETRNVLIEPKLLEENDERRVVFENIEPGIDLVYRLNEGGIKEEIVIKERPAADNLINKFIFELADTNLSFRQSESGIWSFYDSTDKPIFRIPKAWAKDNSGAFTNDVETAVTTSAEGKTTLSLLTPATWLLDPNRIYPVLIDPTVEIVPELREGYQTSISAEPLAVSLYTNESGNGAQFGAVNPVAVGDPKPVFSAIYQDGDSTAIADKYEVVIYADPGCSTPVWDSGTDGTSMIDCTQGNRCIDIKFAGEPLNLDGSQYYWKMKYWNSNGTAGAFSECTDSFTLLGPANQTRHGRYFFNNSTKNTFNW